MKAIFRILVVVGPYLFIVALLIFHSVYGMDGNFYFGKYKVAYILTVIKNTGPRMCLLQCARIHECHGINYYQSQLYCQLLLETASDVLIDEPGYQYGAKSEWTFDNDVCYPNPCRPMQKCVITYNNLPVCVKIKDTKRNDCMDIKKILGATRDGVYKLQKNGNESVMCDMTTDKGGWTVFQQRLDGSVDFYRGWDEYKNGFGDVNGEFWMGNEKLHALTSSRNYKLRIDLEKFDGTKTYVVYSTFVIGNEASGYKLNVSGYSGNAGDSMYQNNGKEFSTYEHGPYKSYAGDYAGAWWWGIYHYSNLNGKYQVGQKQQSTIYMGWYNSGNYYSQKKSKMMIQPIR